MTYVAENSDGLQATCSFEFSVYCELITLGCSWGKFTWIIALCQLLLSDWDCDPESVNLDPSMCTTIDNYTACEITCPEGEMVIQQPYYLTCGPTNPWNSEYPFDYEVSTCTGRFCIITALLVCLRSGFQIYPVLKHSVIIFRQYLACNLFLLMYMYLWLLLYIFSWHILGLVTCSS